MKGLLTAALLLAAVAAPAQDIPARARTLAAEGHRAEALRILQDRLAVKPEDSDARVMYGLVLSWEGRFDEARRELEQVLREHPGHGDASVGLAGLELRAGHAERAEQVAREARTRRPEDGDLMLVQARAMRALGRNDEAFVIVDRLTVLQPTNDAARRLRDTLRDAMRAWQVQVLYRHDEFDDDSAAWNEGELAIRRRTPVGSVIGRVTRARRFGDDDTQLEVDFYPSLRDGTYLYLSAGGSSSSGFFPEQRYAADVNQSLGRGFELSAGYRRLEFGDGVDILTGALSKYHGRWLVTVRGYHKPDAAGDSTSFHLNLRRYIGKGVDFVGLRYGHGSSREELLEDVAVLGSDVVAGEAEVSLADAVQLVARGSFSREERLTRSRLDHWSGTAGFAVRF